MGNASALTGDIVVAAQGIHSESSTGLHQVGSAIKTNDGRTFRYTKVGGTTLLSGRLIQAIPEDTTNQQSLTVAVAAVGATSMTTTTSTTLALNLLAGGYLTVISSTLGQGITYKLQGNTATAAATGAVFYLDDPVVVATTGTVIVDVKANPYTSTVIAPTTVTSACVGFSVYPITTLYFGWLCTRGVTSCLAQGTVVVGNDLVPAATTTTGTVVSRADASLTNTVGKAINGIASTDYGLIYATID